MVSHWSLSDKKSPQVSRTLLSILADLSNGLYSFRYFQVLQFLYQSFGDCTKSTNHYWYNRHFHLPQFFQFPSKVKVLNPLFTFFQFYSVIGRNNKVQVLFFFLLRGAFNKFPDFFVQAFKIVVDSWKFTMLLLYILWDDWPIFMSSGSNEQLQQ